MKLTYTSEGYPFYIPDENDTPGDTSWVDQAPQVLQNPDSSPADIAAFRTARSVKHSNTLPVADDRGSWLGPANPEKPSYLMQPDLQEAQGGQQFPTGLMQEDSGRFYYADNPDVTVPMVQRPNILPVANTPEGYKFAVPKLLDIVGNVMGNVAGGKVAAKAGEMVLGSGMVKSEKELSPLAIKAKEHFGITHNPKEAGYVMPDGSMLDLSGKNTDLISYEKNGNRFLPKEGQKDYFKDQRNTDHRELHDIMDAPVNFATGQPDNVLRMMKFMNDTGAVRNFPGIGFEISKVPNDAQLNKLIVGHNSAYRGQPLTIDISLPSGEQVIAKTFDKPNIENIKKWINEQSKNYPTLLSDTRNQVAGQIGHQVEKNGFYSALQTAVANAKPVSATGEQWLGYLRNQPGIKAEEIQHVLKDLPEGQITRDKLGEIVKQNKVQLEEKVLGTDEKERQATKKRYREIDNRLNEIQNRFNELHSKPDSAELALERQNLANEQKILAKESGELQSELFNPVKGNNETKYSQYQLPSGENYQEMLLKLPTTKNNKKARAIALEIAKREGYNSLEEVPVRTRHEFLSDAESQVGTPYQAPHFDDNGTNLLVHIRHNDRYLPQTEIDYRNLAGNNKGPKSLHIEEIQSDLHQAGRKQGYKGEKEKLEPEFNKIEQKIVDSNDETIMGQPKIEDALKLAVDKKLITPAEASIYKRYTDIENGKPVPDFPFKRSWDELALKRMIHKAASEGYHAISWTPGEAQALRYDLSKHVDNIKIHHGTMNDGNSHITINGKSGVIGSGMIDKNGNIVGGYDLLRDATNKNISEVVGKEVADKIMQKASIPPPKRPTELPEGYELIKDGKKWGVIPPGQSHARSIVGMHDTKEEALRQAFNHIHSEEAQKGHILENVDLKIGGEGMKGFYDKMLVDKANAIGKKYGSKVEQKELNTGKWDKNKIQYGLEKDGDYYFVTTSNGDRLPTRHNSRQDAAAEMKRLTNEYSVRKEMVHYFPITPELRAKAKEGFPLFSSSPVIIPVDHDPFKDDKKKVKLVPVAHIPEFE